NKNNDVIQENHPETRENRTFLLKMEIRLKIPVKRYSESKEYAPFRSIIEVTTRKMSHHAVGWCSSESLDVADA
ncbi:hypothetical protein, partial [Salinarimonas soli]|uniref:hypothetical protein n=1 Tax=Salinarimonas soli TaxID=1638099 RepID=UPI001AEF1378